MGFRSRFALALAALGVLAIAAATALATPSSGLTR